VYHVEIKDLSGEFLIDITLDADDEIVAVMRARAMLPENERIMIGSVFAEIQL
jgi:hypothetical protein